MSIMPDGELQLTESNHASLVQSFAGRLPAALDEAFHAADIVPDAQVPEDVVTLHSVVRIRHESDGALQTLTLCHPHEAQPETGKISVLSPVGLALLGRRVGAHARWRAPSGQLLSLHIQSLLFQPQAHAAAARLQPVA